MIAKDERSSWFGPPKSVKSGLLTDIAVHVAAPGVAEWRGYRIKLHGGVVFFAFERAPLTRRRLAAYAQRDGYTGMRIAVCGKIIDLLSPECVEIIVDTVREAEARWGISVVLLIFDTVNKGIAHGGGDEDKAKDQNRVAANLTRVQELLPGVHIAGIGHTGKDESRGERGSNARRADIDLGVQITGDKIKTATVVDANDQDQGPLTAFATEGVITGVDDDGDDMNTDILSAKKFSCEATDASKKLSAKQKRAMAALAEALDAHGQAPPANLKLPTIIRVAVKEEHWREAMENNRAISPEATNKSRDFNDRLLSLANKNRVGAMNGWVWIIGDENGRMDSGV